MAKSRRVAACQLLDRQDDVDGALTTIQGSADAAAAAGAALVCFPEGYLGGYTRDPIIARRRALDLRSAAFGQVLHALAHCAPTMVIGLIERSDFQLFHTAVVITHGELIGSYRKRHLSEPGFTCGVELPVFTAGQIRFGVGICRDARDHDDAARLADQGLDVILYPLNNMLDINVANQWRTRHLGILTQRARQTATWVISADVVGSAHDQRPTAAPPPSTRTERRATRSGIHRLE